jgi:P-type E1-E2 ATPase
MHTEAATAKGMKGIAFHLVLLGLGDMRRNRILVRCLRALGNLASVRMLCFDKTGTLPFNRMTVREVCAGSSHVRLDESPSARKKKIAALQRTPLYSGIQMVFLFQGIINVYNPEKRHTV